MFLRPLFPGRVSRVFGAIALVLLLLMVVGGGVATGFLLALVDESPRLVELEEYSPNRISRVVDRTGETTIAEFSVERRWVVGLEDICPEVILAYQAIEDERYYDHIGVSPRDIAVAFATRALRGGRLRGASTITMQLARNTLSDISFERSWERKLREALAAMRIETRYSKSQILEFYLNQITMGNGLYGVEAASRAYFGVSAKELSLAQAATIAGISALPERYNPRDALRRAERGERIYSFGPDDASARRSLVLQGMDRLGFITERELETANQEPMTLGHTSDRSNRAPYFVDLVRRQILSDPDLGSETLFNEGTVIRTTIDYELQQIAEEVLTAGLASVEELWQRRKRLRLWEEEEPENMGWRLDPGERRLVEIAEVTPTGLILRYNDYLGEAPLPVHLRYFDPENIIRAGNLIDIEVLTTDRRQRTFEAEVLDRGHVQGAIAVLDVHTGEILALVGGADWSDESNAGQWNRAILGGRQPGSCFKPMVFAAAMESGLTPSTIFIDERIELPTQPGLPPFVPRNFENEFFGPTTLLEALEHSRNVVTIRLTQALGMSSAVDFAMQFDFTDIRPHWEIPPYVNLGLGIHDVTPLELACAFTAFANSGVITRPRAWTQIDEAPRGGDSIAPPQPLRRSRRIEERVMSEETAAQVVHMMRQVVSSGSGQDTIGDYLLGRPGMPQLAGKTGTTTGTVDAWFAGLTPDWAIVVFVGFDDNATLGPQMTGSRVAGPIWRDFVEQAVAIRPPSRMDFPEPSHMVHCDICSQSGLLWSDACENARRYDSLEVVRYRDVPFRPGTEPTMECPFTEPTRDRWALREVLQP